MDVSYAQQARAELIGILEEVECATPRDHLEFDAKLLALSAVLDYEAGLRETSDLEPQGLPTAARPQAQAFEVIRVHREDWARRRVARWPNRAECPGDSIEWQRWVAGSIAYISAAMAAAFVVIWLAASRGAIGAFDVVTMLVLLPAVFGVVFLLIDAGHFWFGAAGPRERRYRDQVYPPGKKREW